MIKRLKPIGRQKNIKQNLKGFFKGQSGNVALMTAFALFTAIGLVGIAVDVNQAHSARERLQSTTDALALLASRDGLQDQADLQAAADAYFAQAYPGVTGERVEVLSITRTGNRVDVETSNNIDTQFSHIFGRDTVDVRVSASSIFAQRSLDVALVLDITGSMSWPTTGSSGTKLESLQVASTRLMNTFESLDNDRLRVSIVPFAQYVNIGEDQRGEPWLRENGTTGSNVCVGSRPAPFNRMAAANSANRVPVIPGAPCRTPIQPLTKNFNALRTTINNFIADGFTYTPTGLLWGWRTLDSRAPFTEAASSGVGDKVLILMTDGENTRSTRGQNHTGFDVAPANSLMSNLCTQIKNDDITIYTIAYEVPDAFTRNLLRNCASNPSNFFNAQNSASLDAAFANISSILSELRIIS